MRPACWTFIGIATSIHLCFGVFRFTFNAFAYLRVFYITLTLFFLKSFHYMLSSTCIPLVLLDINYFTFSLSVLGVFYSTFNSLAPLHNLYFTFTPLVLRSHSICIFRGVSNPPLFFFLLRQGPPARRRRTPDAARPATGIGPSPSPTSCKC